MAAPTKPKPVLEHYYDVSQAAIRLGLREPEDDSKKGEKWLRDGVNKLGFPCHRMAGQLKFSDSDLAEIADRHRSQRHGNSGTRRKKRTTRAPALTAALPEHAAAA
ncbi:hypothetical protein [Streptomyces poriferorum]|uniref:DNA-binding protein n=1 Tax=Streptomyces poriferorum TaxID=2798799 RepID=A0ABY9J118_9ACTN|nr:MULTISPECIES: hypothetical protein [unclassified Streptomyces]MDP5310475.1 hypothetical protein [Streptomyces sp. Alt4]WLQ60371.1 hypothetical protein P8A19_35330 [Streptomyces sp. Alt2]